MKAEIHPELKAAKIMCTCGHMVETFSTMGDTTVEICSHCHPFYTGQQKIVDTAGRVDRFKKKYGKVQSQKK